MTHKLTKPISDTLNKNKSSNTFFVFYQLYLCVSVERVNTVKRVNKKKRGVDSPSWPLPPPSLWNKCDYHHKLRLCQQLPMHLQTVNRDQRGYTLPRHRGEEAEETLSSFLMRQCCESSFVSWFPSPASCIAKFFIFLFLRWCAFSAPWANSPTPEEFFYLSLPPPDSDAHPTLDFLAPTGSPDDKDPSITPPPFLI